MLPITIHREVIKAAIRMRFGSLRAFAEANRLNEQAVRDLLRGTSNTAKNAVAELMGVEPDQLTISRNVEECSNAPSASHLLNSEAR